MKKIILILMLLINCNIGYCELSEEDKNTIKDVKEIAQNSLIYAVPGQLTIAYELAKINETLLKLIELIKKNN